MKIQRKPTNIILELSPKDYWIRKNEDEPDFKGEWCLTHRIDMSYAGKPDQEGAVFMYLDNVEEFIRAGFDEIL